MKKRIALAAAGLALAGAATVPVGSAFGGITDAAKCAAYTAQLAKINKQIAHTSNPTKLAILNNVKAEIVNKISNIPNC